MKKYKVILHADAETDISSAFEWGRHAWGEEKARNWVRQLYRNLQIGSPQRRSGVLSRRKAKT
jgi:plasmid stabilization system protein ParE